MLQSLPLQRDGHDRATEQQCEMLQSLIAHLVKSPPAMQATLVLLLGQEDPLEKG